MDTPEATRTFCEDCDHLHPKSVGQPSYRAMCLAYPRMKGAGFVTRRLWDSDAPYMLCTSINGGKCPTFKPKRQPTEDK